MERAVRKMLWLTRTYLITEDDSVIEEFKDLRSEQKELRGQTLDFLNRIGKCKLTYDEVNRMLNQTTLINEIEHIAAQIESAFETNEHTIQHNDEEYLQLDKYFKYSIKNFKASCKSLLYEDLEKTKFTCQQIENLKLKSQNLRQKMLERISSDETKYSSHDEELTLRIIDLLNSINNGSLRICEINLNLQQASY
jgi:Na+/phosphate symporter